MWKSNKDIGFIGHIYIYDDNDLIRELEGEKGNWYTEEVPNIKKPKVVFDFGMSGTRIFIAFPSNASVNKPAVRPTTPSNNTPSTVISSTTLPAVITQTSPPAANISDSCNIYRKVIIKSSDNFQEKINEGDDCTEFILVDREYIINSTLDIINKNHILIRPNASSNKPIIKMNSNSWKIFINIYNSTHVEMQNVNLESGNCEKSIVISHSNYSKIIDININISCPGVGIYLESGSNNLLQRNKICNIGHLNEDVMSNGITILDATDSYIDNNQICDLDYCSEPEREDFGRGICHYHIMNAQKLNNTIIKTNQVVELRWCYCSCKWDGGYLSDCISEGRGTDCYERIPDDCPSSSVWCY